jgi:hypothetical protein
MNATELLQLIEEKEKQIDAKLDLIIRQNLNPFPFERIAKAKKLLFLIEECRFHIKHDDLIQAGMRIRDLELEGIVLPDLKQPLKVQKYQ